VRNHPDLFLGIRYSIGEFGGFSFPIMKQQFYPIMVAEKQLCVMRATIWGSGGHWSLRTRSSATGRLAQALCRLDCCQLPIHLTTVTV